MRTFQRLHAKSLAEAISANARGDRDSARLHASRAEMWDALDRDVLRRKANRREGARHA